MQVPTHGRVLEVACGTGIVTRHLRAHLPNAATLMATDLNEPMVEYARRAVGHEASVAWRTADAVRGLIAGNPVLLAMEERGGARPEQIIAALTEALAQAGDAAPLQLPMRTLVFRARAV